MCIATLVRHSWAETLSPCCFGALLREVENPERSKPRAPERALKLSCPHLHSNPQRLIAKRQCRRAPRASVSHNIIIRSNSSNPSGSLQLRGSPLRWTHPPSSSHDERPGKTSAQAPRLRSSSPSRFFKHASIYPCGKPAKRWEVSFSFLELDECDYAVSSFSIRTVVVFCMHLCMTV